jgi:mono/diheme cytochrome c family protein
VWVLVGAAGAIVGCRQDMHDQPKYIPLRESTFFGDNRSERDLPEGTVARGHLDEDTYLYTGMVNGEPGTVFPFPITQADIERGQERFNIYCEPCHSPIGDGRGPVVRRGYKQPPSYHDDRLRNIGVGHFYDVITNGFGGMPDYKAQIQDVRDRWRIAAYIRALQLSQHATLADVPEGERGKIGFTPPVNEEIGGTQVTPPRKIAHPNTRGEGKK